ncbi:MAG: glycine betaine/proline transport system ATP-binding protein [Gammaproteobacteria bacterium]
MQIGTPEELVLDPATDYVREFTRGIPRAKVLSAAAVMVPKTQNSYPETIAANVLIEELVGRAADMEKGSAFGVKSESDEIIGELSRETVIDLLSDASKDA